jgi:hypothetical protein
MCFIFHNWSAWGNLYSTHYSFEAFQARHCEDCGKSQIRRIRGDLGMDKQIPYVNKEREELDIE